MCLSVLWALCRAVFCAGYFNQIVFQDTARGVTFPDFVRTSVFQCASSATLMGRQDSLVHLCPFLCLFCATVSYLWTYRYRLAFVLFAYAVFSSVLEFTLLVSLNDQPSHNRLRLIRERACNLPLLFTLNQRQ